MSFTDGANLPTEYAYDENGNLTQDLNKKIVDIQYNSLNLPEKVEFENGDCISYLYASDGTKLRSTYASGSETSTVSYFGPAVYENAVLAKVLTSDGYVTPSDGTFHYYFCDHQGNVRAVLAQDGTVEETNDYYPFGGLLSSSSASVQSYKYNGKELDRSNGLDWYDYGARWYDATTGRWNGIDPSSEKYYNWSPYAYCKNNPILRIDLDGKDDYVVNNNGFIYLMRKTDRTVDVLYASGVNSGQKATQPKSDWPHIRVSDKSILRGLTDRGRNVDYWDRRKYVATNSLYDAANVFFFARNNTNVEWTLKGGHMDGERTFILGTDSNLYSVSSIDALIKGKGAWFPTFIPEIDIHSHPENPFASQNDMNNAQLWRDVKHSILYKDEIFRYTGKEKRTDFLNINSKDDLIRYILQQFK